jgi:hypothetical protein
MIVFNKLLIILIDLLFDLKAFDLRFFLNAVFHHFYLDFNIFLR